MRATAFGIQPETAEPSRPAHLARQDSQVGLKAPCPPPEELESVPPPEAELPADFVAFLGEQRGLDDAAAFALLCRLLSEYRTPTRREIDVLRRSA
jgi:hypothetical protein